MKSKLFSLRSTIAESKGSALTHKQVWLSQQTHSSILWDEHIPVQIMQFIAGKKEGQTFAVRSYDLIITF